MKRLHNLLPMLGLAAASAFGLVGCGGDETTCGTGTVLQDGMCVPSSTTTCGTGTVLTGGQCVPDGTVICEQGTVYDMASGQCVVDPSACADGTVLVGGVCVPDDDTLTADLEEAAEPNDTTGAGQFDVPALNADTTIHGCITPRAGVRDEDVWLMTATGPTLLEITADGVGGLAAAFIVQDNGIATLPNYFRAGINLTGDTSKRQVYLPVAGDYVLVMDDSRAILIDDLAGGADTCYYTTIKQVAMPTATALTLPQTTGMDSGNVRVLTHTPDAAGDIISLNQNTASTALSPAFVVTRGGQFAMSAAPQSDGAGGTLPPFTTVGGLNVGETVQVIVDMQYSLAVEPQSYAFTSYDISAQQLNTAGTAVTVTKKNTITPIDFPHPDFSYLYFDVAAPTVMHFNLTTSIDVNLVISRRDIFTTTGALALMGNVAALGDEFDVVNAFQNEFVRFKAAGRYYVIVYDPSPTAARGETFTVTATTANVNETVATFGTPLTSQALSAQGRGFHTVDLNNPVWIETGVTATNFGGNVLVRAFDNAFEGWLGGATAANMVVGAVGGLQQPTTGTTPQGYIAARDLRDLFLDISDVGTSAANPTYTLTVQNRPHVNLQTLTAGTPIVRTGMDNVAAGGVQRFIVFGGLSNTLSAVITPANAAADITLNRFNSRTEVLGTAVNLGGAGAAETLAAVFGPQPADFVAFQVSSATATGVNSNDAATAPRLYAVTQGTLTLSDACSGGTTIMTDEDDFVPTATQSLPAFLSGFQLYGEAVGTVPFRISSNGVMAFAFGTALSRTNYGQALPTAGGTNGIVAAYWDDLDHVTVCRKDDATANTMTIQWTGNLYGLTHLRVSTQLIFRMNGVIDFVYGSAHNVDGASAFVGAENNLGLIGTPLGNSVAGTTVAGRSFTLTPSP